MGIECAQMEYWTLTSKNSAKLKWDYYFSCRIFRSTVHLPINSIMNITTLKYILELETNATRYVAAMSLPWPWPQHQTVIERSTILLYNYKWQNHITQSSTKTRERYSIPANAVNTRKPKFKQHVEPYHSIRYIHKL